MKVVLYSFGFKHGYPKADMVFDVRFLPNPYWVPELKAGSGCDPQVALYVLNSDKGRGFFTNLLPLLDFLLEEHNYKGRGEFVMAIGCTGGRHRSVAVTEHLRTFFAGKKYLLDLYHRDIEKE